MSGPALRRAWELQAHNPSDKLVLVALAWYANGYGESSRPSVERLVQMTSLSRASVLAARRRLEEAGQIIRMGTWGPKRIPVWLIPGVQDQDLEGLQGSDGGVLRGPVGTKNGVQQLDTEQKEEQKNTKQNNYPAEVEEAWTRWLEIRRPSRRDLEPSQARLIAKALKVVSLAELERAMEGLMASDWHREHKRQQLSTILATRPGGPTLRDQIEGFIERVGSPSHPASTNARSSHREALVRQAKDVVRQRWAHRDELKGWDRDEFEGAIQRLAGEGIEPIPGPHASTPAFAQVER